MLILDWPPILASSFPLGFSYVRSSEWMLHTWWSLIRPQELRTSGNWKFQQSSAPASYSSPPSFSSSFVYKYINLGTALLSLQDHNMPSMTILWGWAIPDKWPSCHIMCVTWHHCETLTQFHHCCNSPLIHWMTCKNNHLNRKPIHLSSSHVLLITYSCGMRNPLPNGAEEAPHSGSLFSPSTTHFWANFHY